MVNGRDECVAPAKDALWDCLGLDDSVVDDDTLISDKNKVL